MGSLGWALIQCLWCPYKKRWLEHNETQTEGGPYKDLEGYSSWGHKELDTTEVT